ncbi:MAG TPA: hypothetical protein VFK62_04595 [Gaiellaceae bacterium]|nr:hypothetical protein [Gaiellaceae bacterium]
MVDVPAAGSGDSGLEGFSVAGAAGRVGRVAAVNRAPDGLVLVVDAGNDYRVVSAAAVTSVETRPRIVRLSGDGARQLAAAPAVEPRVLRVDSAALVRYVPRELDRLLVDGGPATAPARPGLWILGATLTIVAGVAIFVGATITAEVGAPGAAWLWLLGPLALLVLGLAVLWRALGSGEGRRLSRREKASDAMTFLLGITPRTRQRG